MTQEVLAPGVPGLTQSDVEAVSVRGDEPQWLRERRADAWRTYEALDLPDPGDEEWRRTNVREMTFEPSRPIDLDHEPVRVAGAAVVGDLSEMARKESAIVEKYLGSSVPAAEWKFVALNSALWSNGRFVHVSAGVEMDAPIQLTTSGLTSGAAGFPRTLIVAERHSKVQIIDDSTSEGGGLISGVVEIFVGEGATVEYYNINRWGREVLNFNTVRAVLGRDAKLTALVAGIGSRLTKMRLDAEMPEPGAETKLLGVTFGDGDQHFDYNTFQLHKGAHTISDLQFKSALQDSASLVWYGVTRIAHGATAAEANQTSRNLLLSEHAKAAPIPILEIEAFDVAKCSHGATAGPVEETELFYLESRGVPHDVAEHMLVEGFFADVLDRIPNAELRDRVLDAALAKAGGMVGGGLTFDEMMSA